MRNWAQSLGHQQEQILHRLSKNSVRNHENTRLGTEGGTHGQGSYAQQQGSQMQNKLLGFVNQVPGAGAVTSALGVIPTKDGHGGVGGAAGGFYGSETRKMQTQTTSYVAPVGGGEAQSVYSATSTQTTSYGPPQGPPQSSYSPHPTSSYAPPVGPPSSFAPAHTHHQPPNTSGYAPSYASPPPPPIGIPDALLSGGHGSHHSGHGGGPPFPGGYAPPGGGYGQPHSSGGYAAPQGPPPGFPQAGVFPAPEFPGANTDQPHHLRQYNIHDVQQPIPPFPGSRPPYQGGW